MPYADEAIARFGSGALSCDCKLDAPGSETTEPLRHTCASMLFEAGRNVKQVQEWLGHADPSFTLRTHVHLMDAGVGGAEFFDEAVQDERRISRHAPTRYCVDDVEEER